MFEQFKEFRYQTYGQLKRDCVKADYLFNDGLFGADHLCLDINGTMQNRVLQWLRPKVCQIFVLLFYLCKIAVLFMFTSIFY